MITSFTMTENEKNSLLNKIEENGLKEFGIYGRPILDVWNENKNLLKDIEKTELIVGLENSDLDGHLLELVDNYTEKILQGIRLVGTLLSTDEAKLYIPKYNHEIWDRINCLAQDYEIQVINDMIDAREHELSFFCHLSVIVSVVDIYNNSYYPGTYLSIDGKSLDYVEPSRQLNELIKIDRDDIKGIEVGYFTYSLDRMNEPISDFMITNGHIRTIKKDECTVDNTMIQISKYQKASCGKCVFCREGLIQMQYMTRAITKGKGDVKALDLIKEIGNLMPDHTLCAVGQKAPLYMLSAIENSHQEFILHIKKGKCQADVCQALNIIYIDPHLCTGCGDCVEVCPEDCIEGRAKYIHMIDEFDCTRCGKCIEVCGEDAIIKTSDRLPKLPTRLTKVGRFKRK